jgi:hypothetical protein
MSTPGEHWPRSPLAGGLLCVLAPSACVTRRFAFVAHRSSDATRACPAHARADFFDFLSAAICVGPGIHRRETRDRYGGRGHARHCSSAG